MTLNGVMTADARYSSAAAELVTHRFRNNADGTAVCLTPFYNQANSSRTEYYISTINHVYTGKL